MDLEQAREEYKKVFGKYPNKKSDLKSILDKLPKKEEVKQSSGDAVVVRQGVPGEAKLGRGIHAQHLVYFKGQPRYWTVPTIEAMSRSEEFRKQIVFPENTEYEGSASFNKCKSCG